MANQSDIQSLIQNLSGTHTAGQANVPSAVNNGNPNTVYNTNIQPLLPPMVDGQGNWFTNQIEGPTPTPAFDPSMVPNFSANVGQGWQAPTAPGQGMIDARPRWTIPPLTPIIPPPTTPPGSGNPGTGGPLPPDPVTGGGTTPTPGTNPTNNGGNTGNPMQNGGGGQMNDLLNLLGITRNDLGQLPTGSGRGTYDWGGVGIPLPGGGSVGTGGNGGNFDWQQGLDMLGDALGLGGDWYLSGSGNWDVSNILTSLSSLATGGVPIVDGIMNLIGNIGLDRGWNEDNIFVDHVMDNNQNSFDNTLASAQRRLQQQINERDREAFQRTMEQLGLVTPAGGRDSRSGHSAGSRTAVTNDEPGKGAASDLVDSLQQSEFIKNMMRTGTMNRTHQLER